jgi:S-DNA-T family DNA segregation ATPase FtsK/SpoIIIE
MSQGCFIERQRTLLRDLTSLAAERAHAETDAERRYRETGATARRQLDETLEAIRQRLETDIHAAEAGQRERILEKAEENEQRARKQWDEAVWVAESVYEANERKPQEQLEQTDEIIEKKRQDLLQCAERARQMIRKYRQRTPAIEEEDERPVDDADHGSTPMHRLEQSSRDAVKHLRRLDRVFVARLFRGVMIPFFILLIVVGAGVITGWRSDWQVDQWMGIVVGSTLIVLIAITIGLYVLAKRRVTAVYRPLHHAIQAGIAACDECAALAEAQRDRLDAELTEQRDRETERARVRFGPILEEIAQRRDHHLNRIDERYPKLLERIRQRAEKERAEAEARHDQRIADIKRRCEEDRSETEQRFEDRMRERETKHLEDWETLERTWKDGMARCFAEIEAIRAESVELFPSWDDPRWDGWSPPTEFSPSVRVGGLQVDRTQIQGSLTENERLKIDGPVEFDLPVTLDFPNHCSLLLLADGEGRDQAIRTLQSTMLRLLTALPPGKVRFTIMDPIGLGQSFAGFMHLADYEESFVTSRIWTETRHIEQRLADLTEHMENVIQKYLRNEFASIAEYNDHAGEIAEPYRFLIISDFPANFSETAAQRLASIVSSGARCGVFTLISVDRRLPLPQGIDASDIASHSTTLKFTDGRFDFNEPEFERWPLTLDDPPSETFLTERLHLVGEAAKDATRVEVPFATVAPETDQLWSADCTAAIRVPLGRSGATKLQNLVIGLGTSQHALIAGKTGSGKSTLLHVLVTNLALWYRPEEVQFYLVDFKKGVEFKTYANHDLPHARAVAIESDREFGLSVLQRIDRELKYRGDRFRELGVQDLPAYRALKLDEPMPRILFIVDEFQELFTEDDKIGQDSALLLDRLVRQGRAFGIHVLLGSQTLGGAYTLARSTMGQMQVRIALQCTEADSYLIMSDDNAAARLLSRPGEAIYNDAGGRIEGNSPFQIVWLPEHERERSLKLVAELSDQRGFRRDEPLIVFEGNVPARIADNHLLRSLLDGEAKMDAIIPPSAWLGEAIAIKGPTCATFRRQSGNNLLIVGQQDESALAMSAVSMIALAAHSVSNDRPAKFILLDGTPADAPNAGYLQRIGKLLPQEVRNVAWRDVESAMAELGEELNRRRDADQTDAPPIYLIIHGLHRYRMLRSAGDFGFSLGDDDKPPAADKIFADILRDGPPLGMHVITWCDTATNLNRTLDRGGLRDFEMRVLFQMSGADSTQLIDSPLAGRLGLRRALFYNEEDGVLEKFRPYALPNKAWLDQVQQRFAERAAGVR